MIAHDACKARLIAWARKYSNILGEHELYATGTTGALLESSLDLLVVKYNSGPYGGDQQVGARISEGAIDFLIFFWDPLVSHPHVDDTKALLRVATLWNIPVACNEATADYLVSSPLMSIRRSTDPTAVF